MTQVAEPELLDTAHNSTQESTEATPALRAVPAAGPSLVEALGQYRRQHGLTLREAGHLVGGSHSVWGRWESGGIPSPIYLRRLAELLGLSVGQTRQLAGPDRVRRVASTGDEESCALARARFAAGLSSSDLARLMHVSLALVSRWESGERTPGRHYWPRLAAVLGLDPEQVDEIFGHRRAPSDVVAVPALRALRTKRGLTQTTLAAAVGVDVTSIQRWERHGSAPHGRATAIASALRTDLAALARPVVVAASPKRAPGPLRRLRQRRSLPVRVVAARVGVSPSALWAWERGCAQPSWAHARALARALGVPVDEVFASASLSRPHHLDPARWSLADVDQIIRELRRWQGLTQQQLAALVGVSPATVRAWEAGRQRPRRNALRRLDQLVGASTRLAELPRG